MNRIVSRLLAVNRTGLVRKIILSDLTKYTVICCSLVGIGDAIAQLYSGERDFNRLIDMSAAGVFLGPWYKESFYFIIIKETQNIQWFKLERLTNLTILGSYNIIYKNSTVMVIIHS